MTSSDRYPIVTDTRRPDALSLSDHPWPDIVLLVAGYVLFPWPMPAAPSFTLVAHRGVHQTHPGRDEGVKDETCTAELIDPPRHGYIENTISSMAAAFAAGADAVELDVHRTADEQLIVFHDWTLDCRTNGTGVTNQQTVADLQRLDIGYGYTADGGQTYPLRGQGVGLMPTLPEVLDRLPGPAVHHPRQGWGRRNGSDSWPTSSRPCPRPNDALLSYWGGKEIALIQASAPEVEPYFASGGDIKGCLGDYLGRMLVLGSVPERCRERILAIPYSRLHNLPGWPHLILARAHQAGVRVYVVDVDTPEEWASLQDLPLDGIQTNRIEEIGPLIQHTSASGGTRPDKATTVPS